MFLPSCNDILIYYFVQLVLTLTPATSDDGKSLPTIVWKVSTSSTLLGLPLLNLLYCTDPALRENKSIEIQILLFPR